MGKKDISRRDFLRIFPGLAAKKAESVKESIEEATGTKLGGKKAKRKPAPPSSGEAVLPIDGSVVEGIPVYHPWIGAAHGIAAWMKRPRSFAWRLGATGEAFSLYYSREEPLAALRTTPGNTFLLALAISGISAHATHGGPFDPAIGGVEVALGRDLSVVLATKEGPALVRDVDTHKRTVDWIRPGEGRTAATFDEVERDWETAWWPGGEAPFVRIVLELDADRAVEKVTMPAIEAGVMLVKGGSPQGMAMGAAAWEAFALDVGEYRFTQDQADVLIGEILPKTAVARLAAGTFLEEVAVAVPENRRAAVEEAARKFRHIHAPSILGETFGTGLLPEAADCMLTDGLPDLGKLADAAFRDRASELLLEIRDCELEAAALIEEAFDKP